MNLFDILIILLIAAAVIFAVKSLFGRRSSCCGSCTKCPMHCDIQKEHK